MTTFNYSPGNDIGETEPYSLTDANDYAGPDGKFGTWGVPGTGDTVDGGGGFTVTGSITVGTWQANVELQNGTITADYVAYVVPTEGGVVKAGRMDNLVVGDGGDAEVESLTTGVIDIATSGDAKVTSFTGEGGDVLGTLEIDSFKPDGGGLKTNFDIEGGGKLTVTSELALGAGATDADEIDITDAGSTLTFGATLVVGEAGAGTLQIRDGASETFKGVTIAAQASSRGNVLVDGPGSRLQVSGALAVGEGGQGSLQAADSAVLTVSGALELGVKASGNGQAYFLGTGKASGHADATIRGDLEVGIAGTGSATFDNAFAATVGGDLAIGVKAGGSGSLFVSRASTVSAGNVTVGEAATGKSGSPGGTLIVTAGGVLDASGGAVVLAESAGSTAALSVTSDGSELLAGSLTVGSGGNAGRIGQGAAPAVSGGGTITVGADLTIAEEKGSQGELDVAAGGTLVVGGDATIGGGGKGTLTVEGGIARVHGAHFTLGEEAGSKGTLVVEGKGGALDFAGDMTIGEKGSGSVTVKTAGKLVPGGMARPHGTTNEISLGESAKSSGKLTIDGQGSQVKSHEITVGALGNATLKVTGNAVLTTTGDATIADNLLATFRSATVDTQARWTIGGDLTIGALGLAKTTVQGGATLADAGSVTLGETTGASGILTVTGTAKNGKKVVHSTLDWHDALTVGEHGAGRLSVAAGAHLAITKGGDGALEIAALKTATGTATVDGAGTTLTGKSLAVGGTAEKAGGKASLTVSDHAAVTFATASVWKHGAVALNGGTLHVTGAVDGNGAITIGKGGTLVLGGEDHSVGVVFAAASKGAVLSLAAADLLDATIKGFAKGDSIKIAGLDAQATFAVKASGANTVVTITDHGHKGGSLTLAGHYAQASLHLKAGVLTTTAAGSTGAVGTATEDDSFVFGNANGSGGATRTPDHVSVGEPAAPPWALDPLDHPGPWIEFAPPDPHVQAADYLVG